MTVPARSGMGQLVFLRELMSMRTHAGLSPAELAERLGVNESVVLRSEAGTRKLGVVELQRWAFACGSTLEEFGRRLDTKTLQ